MADDEKVRINFGLNGPDGFVAYPGEDVAGLPYDEWAERMTKRFQEISALRAQMAREAKILATQSGTIAPQEKDVPYSPLGRVSGSFSQPPDDHSTHLRLAQEQAAREAKIGARDMMGAYAAKQAQDGPSSPMIGGPMPVGNRYDGGPQAGALHTMARAPGKMFRRSDILAILRAERTSIPAGGGEMMLMQRLITTFENLE